MPDSALSPSSSPGDGNSPGSETESPPATEQPSPSPPSSKSPPPDPKPSQPSDPPSQSDSPPSGSGSLDSPPPKSSPSAPPPENPSPPESSPPAPPESSPPAPPESSPPAPPDSSSQAAPPPDSSKPPPDSSKPKPPPPDQSPPPKDEPPPSSTPSENSPPPDATFPPPTTSQTQSPPPSQVVESPSLTPPTLTLPPPPSENPVNPIQFPPPIDPGSGSLTPPSETPPTSSTPSTTPSTVVTPSLSSPTAQTHVPSTSSKPSGSGSGSNPSMLSRNSRNSDAGGLGKGAVAGIALAGVATIALVAFIFIFLARRRKRRPNGFVDPYRPPTGSFSAQSDGYYYRQGGYSGGYSGQSDFYHTKPPPSPLELGHSYGSYGGPGYQPGQPEPAGIGNSKSCFTYEELADTTCGFSKQNLLGEGGFGCVYKGCLPDGKEVAVKQLKAGGGQGDREFRAEVEIISRVHHRHLVSLVGYCIAEHHRLLVYEFVPNNTLEHHLHGKPVMDWANRLKIAIGAAKGLAYLHEDCHPRIIHRDIKSANILLDNSFDAQVADFGLAKLTTDTYTHVSTRVMGTFGYMAPEYASSGKLTDRSDVFSFGVVLLEIVTGRKPVDTSQPLGEESLVEWARPLLARALDTREFDELVDPMLEDNYVRSEMFRMIEVAAACVRHSAPKRPRMVQVVRALDSDGGLSDLTNGVKPGQSTVFNSGQYSVDIQKFRQMAFGSNDYSSDYGSTGDYDNRSGPYSGEQHPRETRQRPGNYWGSNGTTSDYPSSGESETRAMNQRNFR